MKNLMQLKEEYPNIFKYWMTERDIIEVLDRKWTSREYVYLDKKGIGTFDILEADVKEVDKIKYCISKCTIEISFRKIITVYLKTTLLNWDEEEQCYYDEISEMIGWD